MEDLPEQCNYLALGAARIREIKAIVSKLDNCEHGNRVFQNLPRHMQRRAVSANPRRLPRYLREKHMREGGANVKPTHRPRRKYRRRPCNLLLEYNRRQKEYTWLETHIWHAKRFRMIRQWGYALPDTPTFKGYRASLRATKKSCLLQDVSFMCCIELEGPQVALLNGLSSVIQPASLSLLSDTQIQLGRRPIEVILFQPFRQPYGAIGTTEMLWHPHSDHLKGKSRVWLWVHPSVHSQVVDVLTEVFSFVKTDSAQEDDKVSQERVESIISTGTEEKTKEAKEITLSADEKVREYELQNGIDEDVDIAALKDWTEDDQNSKQKRKKPEMPKNVNKAKIAKKNIPFVRTPKYTSASSEITMMLLKDTLNRFRLTGPQAHSVISSALHPAAIIEKENTEAEDDVVKSEQLWWLDYYAKEESKSRHLEQVNAWKQLFSCSKPRPGTVLPLVVRDPRVTLPHKKIPLETATSETEQKELGEWPLENPIYDCAIRDAVTLSKEPDAVINQRRHQLLVPGSQLPETAEESRLPLLLLARRPTYCEDYGYGWDMIVPAGWGMSVWMPLIFCGGVAGGQQEAENLHMEIHTSLPPYLLPDTPAGDYYSGWLANKRHTDFFRRPPANRLNFIKLGVQFPFSQPWRKLAQDWEPGTQDIYVLRDPKPLRDLARIVQEPSCSMSITKKRKTENVDELPCKKMKITDQGKEESASECTSVIDVCSIEQKLQGLNYGSLVLVKLELCYKGVLEPCAMICLPLEEDLQARETPAKPSSKIKDISEPPHPDTKAQQRARLKEEHHKIKCRMQRQRRKARQRVSLNIDVMSSVAVELTIKQATAEALKKVENDNQVILHRYSSFNEEMENAWLMDTHDPLQCCSRKILGYVTHGTFSQTLGKGAGIGWVSLKALLRLMQVCCGGSSATGEQKGCLSDDGRRVGKNNICLVLTRNPSSFQYRWAKLFILV